MTEHEAKAREIVEDYHYAIAEAVSDSLRETIAAALDEAVKAERERGCACMDHHLAVAQRDLAEKLLQELFHASYDDGVLSEALGQRVLTVLNSIRARGETNE